MSTLNLADLPATAGGSEQRLPPPIVAPRISTVSGGSLADALQIVHEMCLTEKMGVPRKMPNSDLSKNCVHLFLPLLCGGKQKDTIQFKRPL